MLILTLRTDKPEAELGLYEDQVQLAYETWQAHRQLAETIHHKIQGLVETHGKAWRDIKGIVFYKGPGSFTGLRIGAAVANALASDIPAALVAINGEAWLQTGCAQLLAGENQPTVTIEYGAAPHITQQKK